MNPPCLTVVFGATGKSGGSVISSLLAANKNSVTGDLYTIRAVTRHPSSDKSQAFAAQGVEIFEGDVNDYYSVLRAFEGAELAFGTTDFWGYFSATEDSTRASTLEIHKGKNLADAAAETHTLRHYVWDSLPCVDYSVPHMQSKALVDDYITITHPRLAQKTTFLFLGYPVENLKDIDPPRKEGHGDTYLWRQPAEPTAQVPVIGYVELNMGIFVEAIFRNRERTLGKYVHVLTDVMSLEEILTCWADVAGVKARLVEVTLEDYEDNFHLGTKFGAEIGLNMLYLAHWHWERDLEGWRKEGYERITRDELGISQDALHDTKQTLRDIDWHEVLQ